MVSRLIPQVGYGWTMRIAAFFILGLLIVANLTVRSLNPPSPHAMTKKELRAPFTDIKLIFTLLGQAFFTFGVFVPITFLIVQATAGGMSPDLAQYLLAILNAARYAHISKRPIKKTLTCS